MIEPGTEPHADEVREKINETLAWLRLSFAWALHKYGEEPGTWEELEAQQGPRTMPEAMMMMSGGGRPPPPPDDLP